jgi:hypothetical protein
LSNVIAFSDTSSESVCKDVAEEIQREDWLPSGKYIHIG